MTHRVNTRVFRAGKTLRWDFTAASTNLLEVTRLHYIAVTALQYILRRHGLEVFRVFIGLETHILLIRVIAYRRVVLRLEYDDVDLQAPFGVYSRALAARDSEEHFDEVKLVATPELPRLVRSNVRDFYYRYRKANVTSRIRVSSSGRGLLSRTDYSKGRSWLPIIKGERKGFDLQLLLRAERGLVPTFGSSAPFEAEIEEFFYAPEASLFTAELAAFYYSIGFVVVDALQVKTSASVRSRRAARIGAASCILAGRSITFLAGSGLRAGVGSRLSAIVPHLYGESLLSAFSGAAFNEAMRLAWARSIFSSAVEVSLVPALRVASKEKGLVVYFSLFSSILKSGVPFTRLEHARGSSVQHLILLLGCVRLLRATGGGGRRAPVSGVTARLTRLFLCALLYFKSDRYRVMRSLRLAPAISRKKVEAGRYRGEDREAQKWRALWLLARPGMTAVGTPEQTVAQAAAMCLRSWKSWAKYETYRRASMFMVRMRAELPDALKSVLSARIFDGAAGATQSRILINLTTKPQAGISADWDRHTAHYLTLWDDVEKILRVNDLRLRKVVTTESITQTAANLKYKKKVVRRWGCLAAMKKLNYLASILPHAGLEPKQYAAAKRIVRALGAYVDDTIAEFGRGTEERSVLAPKVTQLATALTAILKVRRYNLIINLDSDPFDAASMCSLKFDSAAPIYRPVPRYFRSLIKELSPVLVNFLRVAARFIEMREAAPANWGNKLTLCDELFYGNAVGRRGAKALVANLTTSSARLSAASAFYLLAHNFGAGAIDLVEEFQRTLEARCLRPLARVRGATFSICHGMWGLIDGPNLWDNARKGAALFRGVTPAGEAFPDHHGGAATAISKIRYLGRRGVRTLSSSDVVTEAHGTSLVRILKYNLNRDLSAVFGAYCNLEYVPLEDIFGWANTRLAVDVLNLRAVVRARASRDPRVGEWLVVFGILLLASLATRSLTALLDFMCAVYRRNKYWWRPHGYMMELINGANLRAYGIMGLRIVYHGKFSGQERAVRMIRTWGLNPCLRNSLLKCVYVEKQCTSRHGITHVHIWMTYL